MTYWIRDWFYALLPGTIGRKIYRLSEICEEVDQLFGKRVLKETAGINSIDLEFYEGDIDRRVIQKYRNKMSKNPQELIQNARIKGAVYGTIAELLGYVPLEYYGLGAFSDEQNISLLTASGLTFLLRISLNGAVNFASRTLTRDFNYLKRGSAKE